MSTSSRQASAFNASSVSSSLLEASRKFTKATEILAPVVLELADASAAVAGVGLAAQAVRRVTGTLAGVYRAGGRVERSVLHERLYESARQAQFVTERIRVLARQALALRSCLSPSTLRDASAAFDELLAFIAATLPELPLYDDAASALEAAGSSSPRADPEAAAGASPTKRVRSKTFTSLTRGVNAFVSSDRRLAELGVIMQRVNGAFSAVLSDALVVMSFHALRSAEGSAAHLDADFAEIATGCQAEASQEGRAAADAAAEAEAEEKNADADGDIDAPLLARSGPMLTLTPLSALSRTLAIHRGRTRVATEDPLELKSPLARTRARATTGGFDDEPVGQERRAHALSKSPLGLGLMGGTSTSTSKRRRRTNRPA